MRQPDSPFLSTMVSVLASSTGFAASIALILDSLPTQARSPTASPERDNSLTLAWPRNSASAPR